MPYQLGGYVKFLGDEDATSKPDHTALDNMSEEDREGAFDNKALWRRAAIVAAGPIANFILARRDLHRVIHVFW